MYTYNQHSQGVQTSFICFLPSSSHVFQSHQIPQAQQYSLQISSRNDEQQEAGMIQLRHAAPGSQPAHTAPYVTQCSSHGDISDKDKFVATLYIQAFDINFFFWFDPEINECISSPCQHNSSCTDQINGYDCNCTVGYTDRDCQTGEPSWCGVPWLSLGGVYLRKGKRRYGPSCSKSKQQCWYACICNSIQEEIASK